MQIISNSKSFSTINKFIISFTAFAAVFVFSTTVSFGQFSYSQPNDYIIPDATASGSGLKCGTNATPGNWVCGLVNVGTNGTPVLPPGSYSVSAEMWVNHDDVGDLEAVLVAPNGTVPANGNYNDALTVFGNRTSLFARVGATTPSTQCGSKARADGTYRYSDAGGANGTFWSAAASVSNAANAINDALLYAPVNRNNTATSIISNLSNIGNFNGVWRVCMRDTNRVWNGQNGANSGNKGGMFGKIVLRFSQSTSAPAAVSGAVVDDSGMAIRNATVSILNTVSGESRTARTNSFGYFAFENLPTSEFYILTVKHSRYQFDNDTISFTLNENVSDIVFQGRSAPRIWDADGIEKYNQKIVSGGRTSKGK